MAEDENKYNKEWFRNRALNSIKKIGPNTWDYSDSLLLYISASGSDTYEELQETGSPYFNLITKPEQEYLVSIAKDIAEALPTKFEYIDLGPGTEHKEQFFFDELKKLGKEFIYRPVDISQHFLDLAEKHASEQGITSKPIQASFEELPEKLGNAELPRFVSLGLTFSNYSPQIILKLLSDISGTGGLIFINAQIRDRVDMKELERIYSEDSAHMADEKLELLGLKHGEDVTIPRANEDIRTWCSVLKASDDLQKLGVQNGDRLLVFQSLRYTKESLGKELREFGKPYEIFDTGSSFIGSLIKV